MKSIQEKKLVLIVLILSCCGIGFAQTLFMAHYDGDTSNFGCDADYAGGIRTASVTSDKFDDWPSLTSAEKFGAGSLDLDWWFGRSLNYSTSGNLNISAGTIEFFLRANDVFTYDLVEQDYIFHGGSSSGRRFIFNTESDSNSGHIDMWIEQVPNNNKAVRVVAHIRGDRSGTGFTITLNGPNIYGVDGFKHCALQWDSTTGKAALFFDGALVDKAEVTAWTMSHLAPSFALCMGRSDWNIFNTGALNIDEFRISNTPLYNSNLTVGTKSFDVQTLPFNNPGKFITTFLAHYNGDTGNGGLNADFASGSGVVSIPDSNWGIPTINTTNKKFGSGAVNLPWWTGRNMDYFASGNYDNAEATVEFQLNMANIFTYDSNDQRYEFDGNRRYVFNDDLTWGTSGHVDVWVDGTAGATSARVIAHVQGVRNGTVFTITKMGPLVTYTGGGNTFQHYALQWDAAVGAIAVFCQGILADKSVVDPWVMSSSPTVFKIGMQSNNAGELILDELRISNRALYNADVNLNTQSFDIPVKEFPVTTFLAHYNGDTDHNGLNADYSAGSPVPTTSASPTINTVLKKFGLGAVNMPWWSSASMSYNAGKNYKNSAATIEFQLNMTNVYNSSTHLFDGNRRYVFNDDLAWGTSGHVDCWIDGTAGATTARLVVHVQCPGSTITKMGPPISYTNGGNTFQHYAIQWDAANGKVAVFCQGVLSDKSTVTPWTMSSSPTVFKIGMQSNNVGALILDEFRISDGTLYDSTGTIGSTSFVLPSEEYPDF